MERKVSVPGVDKFTLSVNTLGMTQSLQDRVAAEVRAELGRQRMSQQAFAAALGRSDRYVSDRLSGRLAINLVELEDIARVLGVDVQQLMGERAA